jgi:hypothetical protein
MGCYPTNRQTQTHWGTRHTVAYPRHAAQRSHERSIHWVKCEAWAILNCDGIGARMGEMQCEALRPNDGLGVVRWRSPTRGKASQGCSSVASDSDHDRKKENRAAVL